MQTARSGPGPIVELDEVRAVLGKLLDQIREATGQSGVS